MGKRKTIDASAPIKTRISCPRSGVEWDAWFGDEFCDLMPTVLRRMVHAYMPEWQTWRTGMNRPENYLVVSKDGRRCNLRPSLQDTTVFSCQAIGHKVFGSSETDYRLSFRPQRPSGFIGVYSTHPSDFICYIVHFDGRLSQPNHQNYLSRHNLAIWQKWMRFGHVQMQCNLNSNTLSFTDGHEVISPFPNIPDLQNMTIFIGGIYSVKLH